MPMKGLLTSGMEANPVMKSHSASLWGIISGNKSLIGSVEVPIDRSCPDAQHVNFPQQGTAFNGRGWSSKLKKANN